MTDQTTDRAFPAADALRFVVWCQSLVAAAAIAACVFGVMAAVDAGVDLGWVVAGVGVVVTVAAGMVGVLAYARWRIGGDV